VPVLRFGDRTLFLIHLQAETLLDESGDTCHHTVTRALASDVDVEVVRVAHEAMTALRELLVELAQHDVAQQRRERTSLRGALARAHHHAIRHHHLGLQQAKDQP